MHTHTEIQVDAPTPRVLAQRSLQLPKQPSANVETVSASKIPAHSDAGRRLPQPEPAQRRCHELFTTLALSRPNAAVCGNGTARAIMLPEHNLDQGIHWLARQEGHMLLALVSLRALSC